MVTKGTLTLSNVSASCHAVFVSLRNDMGTGAAIVSGIATGDAPVS